MMRNAVYRVTSLSPVVMLATGLAIGLTTGPVRADDNGLADLDKAVEVQLFAASEDDLNRVVSLCESALEKGLSESNEQFARHLISATLYQHAAALSRAVFDEDALDRRAILLGRQALPKLEKAVSYDEEFGDAYFLMARLQALPGGDRDKAQQAVAKAIELAGDNQQQHSEALVLRGDLQDDDDLKLADYNQAILIDPANKEALRHRGMLFLRKGEHEKATQDFNQMIEEGADNLAAYHALVEAFTNQKKYDEALQQLAKAIEINPGSSLNYTLRARIRVLQDDVKGGIDDLNRALELDERDIAALMMRAQLHQSQEDFKSAKRDVEKVLIYQPGLVQGYLLRSMIYAADQDYMTAASDLETLLRTDPKNISWRLQLATFYALDKRASKAIEVYSDVLLDEQNNVAALRGRADALLSLGRQAEAIADYEATLMIDPQHSGALNNLAWVLATSPDHRIRDAKRSVELGTKACEVTEYKEAHILSTLAAGFAEAGDFESAIKWSTRAVDLGELDVKEQLKAELESYKQKKPWRERQQLEEKPEPTRGGGDFGLR